jgi:MFS family permease
MTVDRDAVQRRTIGVLTVSQAFGGLGISIGIAVASVLAEDVSGSESLAGLAQTFQVLGTAAASYLLARIMGTRGRRIGIVAGYLCGSAGALLCVFAGAAESFPLLLGGAFLLGATSASNFQSRYAAADLARPAHRARALATVVWATTIGAVLGPNLSGPSGDLARGLGLPELTGPFLISVGAVTVAALVVGVFLRPDPLLLARELEGLAPGERKATSWARVLEVLRERPAVGAGVLAISSAHAVMVAVMVMTPLHMDHGGATLNLIGLVISIHVLGMFAFAPLVGAAADRFGRPTTMAAGAIVLLVSLYLSGTAPMGASWRIGIGLFLLGLGWSLCTVAGSALLTEATPIDARTGVQGAADLVMNATAAAAGAGAGLIVDHLGFGSLNAFAAVLVSGVVIAVALAARDSSHTDVGGDAAVQQS